MTIERFLNHVVYSTICPEGVDPARWRGMLRWYEARTTLGEPFRFDENG